MNEHLEQLMDAIERTKNAHVLKLNQVKADNPDLSFGDVWEKARSESPSLFEQFDITWDQVLARPAPAKAATFKAAVLPKVASQKGPILVHGSECGMVCRLPMPPDNVQAVERGP